MQPRSFALVLITAIQVPGVAAQARPQMSEVLQKTDGRLGKRRVRYAYVRDGKVNDEQRTLAPYFYVAGGNPEVDRLPLKKTSATVRIAGVIAKVRVRQLFENDGTKPIEAVYVFPASTRAAVHGMRMRIGNRTVEAKIERRKEARQRYERAKRQGQRASLLEQQRPNVFTMNVANIMPKDRIQVELDYSELLVPEDAIYEFVYPAVVGPRFAGGADRSKDRWIESPYMKSGQAGPYEFGIDVELETGIPIKALKSPSHHISVKYDAPNRARVSLAKPGGGNRDFVLRYRLAGDKIEAGLLMDETGDAGYFLLMLEPPRQPTRAQIPSREYIFLLDVSGSMHGFPLNTAKTLIRRLLSKLRPSDYFNVVLFAGSSYVMRAKGSLPATQANIRRAVALIDRQRGGGGTQLLDGLRASYRIPKAHQHISRSVVVITDGYVAVEAQTFKFIRERLNQASVFSFGIGSSVNRALIESMARAGQGEPFVVLGPQQAAAQAEKLRQYIQQPVLTNINVRFKGLDAYDLAPERVPDLMARRPIVVLGKFRKGSRGVIDVSGYSGVGKVGRSVTLDASAAAHQSPPVRRLWARKWAAMLGDQLSLLPGDADLKQAITHLGLTYNLLTRFTSFVAVDSEVANRSGRTRRVKQPVPLPQGVSNLAVGGAARGRVIISKPANKGAALAPAPSVAPRRYIRSSLRKRVAGPGGLGLLYGAGTRGRSKDALSAPAAAEESRADHRPAKTTSRRRIVALALVRSAHLARQDRVVKFLRQVLDRAGRRCAVATTPLALRLVIDGKGKIVEVRAAGPGWSTRARACLRSLLLKLVAPGRAQGATRGVIQVKVQWR